MAQPESRHFSLEKLHEYRFELEKGESISIRLNGGSAEIFGFELSVGVDYPFGNECRAAVFTFHGAQIEIGVLALFLICYFEAFFWAKTFEQNSLLYFESFLLFLSFVPMVLVAARHRPGIYRICRRGDASALVSELAPCPRTNEDQSSRSTIVFYKCVSRFTR
jgi:hypothetical protein